MADGQTIKTHLMSQDYLKWTMSPPMGCGLITFYAVDGRDQYYIHTRYKEKSTLRTCIDGVDSETKMPSLYRAFETASRLHKALRK